MFVRLIATVCWALAGCQGDTVIIGSDFHADAAVEFSAELEGRARAGGAVTLINSSRRDAGPEMDAAGAPVDAGTDAELLADAGADAAQGEPDAEVCEPNGCGGCGCPAAWADWGSCEPGAPCAIESGQCPQGCFTSAVFSDEFYCGSGGQVLCAQCPACGI